MKKHMILLSCILLASLSASAQVVESYDSLRTNSWSVYAMGGASTARGDNLFENVNPSQYVFASPMAGAGVTFNVRPWIRFNLGYEISKYRRQQRFGSVQSDGLSFRNLDMLYNDAELNLDLNFMELFRNRKSKIFNIYLGSGIGGMYAIGADYTIRTSVTGTSSDNITYGVNAHNELKRFITPYVPANLSIECDVTPRFTLGLKLNTKFMLKRESCLAGSTQSLGLVMRYNFVGKKHGYTSKRYQIDDLKSEMSRNNLKYSADIGDLNRALDEKARLADKLNSEVGALVADLSDCNGKNATLRKEMRPIEPVRYTVYFDNASSRIDSDAENVLLDAIAYLKQNREHSAVITATCSTPGSEEYNQALSEKRAEAVRASLIASGIEEDQISLIRAEGEKDMNADARSRRAVIEIR